MNHHLAPTKRTCDSLHPKIGSLPEGRPQAWEKTEGKIGCLEYEWKVVQRYSLGEFWSRYNWIYVYTYNLQSIPMFWKKQFLKYTGMMLRYVALSIWKNSSFFHKNYRKSITLRVWMVGFLAIRWRPSKDSEAMRLQQFFRKTCATNFFKMASKNRVTRPPRGRAFQDIVIQSF